jgi:hypothetical protein
MGTLISAFILLLVILACVDLTITINKEEREGDI